MSMFEKMFGRNTSTPQENPEESSTKKTLSSLEKAAKMATVLMLLSGPLQAAPEGALKEGGQEENKIEDTRAALGKIISFIEKNDKTDQHTFAGVDVKGFEKDGQEIICATDKSFVILSIGEGQYTYFDANSDGSLDRLVINNEEKPEDRRLVKNGLYVFTPMDELFEQVAIIADLLPEKIKTLAFDLNKMEVSFTDSEEGSSGVIDGDKAKEVISKFQDNYARRLQKIASEQAE